LYRVKCYKMRFVVPKSIRNEEEDKVERGKGTFMIQNKE